MNSNQKTGIHDITGHVETADAEITPAETQMEAVSAAAIVAENAPPVCGPV